ncbi:MAG: hypothetical protein FJ030_12395 [Chloroflexi bacterium]|nr:hypothetical protein [Chloroflexota bacterium]
MQTPQQPNTLGNASLWMGIASSVLVFGIGLCALAGARQGWIGAAAAPLLVCGATSAFVGLIGAIVGVGGLFGANRSKATAVVGVILGVVGLCLFFGALAALRR